MVRSYICKSLLYFILLFSVLWTPGCGSGEAGVEEFSKAIINIFPSEPVVIGADYQLPSTTDSDGNEVEGEIITAPWIIFNFNLKNTYDDIAIVILLMEFEIQGPNGISTSSISPSDIVGGDGSSPSELAYIGPGDTCTSNNRASCQYRPDGSPPPPTSGSQFYYLSGIGDRDDRPATYFITAKIIGWVEPAATAGAGRQLPAGNFVKTIRFTGNFN